MPRYQQRHYEDVAAILRDVESAVTRAQLIVRFRVLFAADNTKFAGQKFSDASSPLERS